jgi:hypothetical protein
MIQKQARMVLCELLRMEMLRRLLDYEITIAEIEQDRTTYFAVCEDFE